MTADSLGEKKIIFETMLTKEKILETLRSNKAFFEEELGVVRIGLFGSYAKGKQIWFFWGILPFGRTSVNTPGDGNCQVITRYNLVDALISGLTGGIVTSYTIKVKAKRVK